MLARENGSGGAHSAGQHNSGAEQDAVSLDVFRHSDASTGRRSMPRALLPMACHVRSRSTTKQRVATDQSRRLHRRHPPAGMRQRCDVPDNESRNNDRACAPHHRKLVHGLCFATRRASKFSLKRGGGRSTACAALALRLSVLLASCLAPGEPPRAWAPLRACAHLFKLMLQSAPEDPVQIAGRLQDEPHADETSSASPCERSWHGCWSV